MKHPTVYAVMTATIEIPVRSSSPDETLQQLYDVSKREAEGILANKLGREFHLVQGSIKFHRAIVVSSDDPKMGDQG